MEPRDTKPKDGDNEGDIIVEPTEEDYYTAIPPKPHPDLTIPSFEVSMASNSINSSFVIPRDIDTILALANALKLAKQIAFKKKTKQEMDFADNTTKMMYVSGETAEPAAETTGMVEEIVRQQVIEMVSPPQPYFDFKPKISPSTASKHLLILRLFY